VAAVNTHKITKSVSRLSTCHIPQPFFSNSSWRSAQ